MTYFVLALYLLAVARLTRLINRDTVLDTPRIWIAEKAGAESKLTYFIGCPWCVSIWLAFATAWLPVHLLNLSWWVYPLLALAVSHLIGLADQLDDEEIEVLD